MRVSRTRGRLAKEFLKLAMWAVACLAMALLASTARPSAAEGNASPPVQAGDAAEK